MRYFLCLVIVVVSLSLGASLSFAQTAYEPAFKTLGVWDANTQMRVDFNVWYPTHSRPSPANYAPWTINVVRYGRSAKGRFPLLLLSHDTAATRFSYHETAAMLAKSGFVVIAPSHKNDNVNNIAHPFTMRQLTERAEELNFTLEIALTHEEVRKNVDPNRVGILGFGLGGSAAFLLGGAKPNAEAWKNYCIGAQSASIYCGNWVRERINKMVAQLPLKQDFHNEHIKAVAVVAPQMGMLFSKTALKSFSSKLLLVEAANDSVNKKPQNTQRLRKNFPMPSDFVRIEGVDLPDLMSACPPELRAGLAELCGTNNAKLRNEAHNILNAELIKFFLSTLGNLQEVN